MSNKKAAILAGMLASTMAEQERKDFYEFTNPYDGLDGLTYSGSGQKGYSKSPITKKQKNEQGLLAVAEFGKHLLGTKVKYLFKS